MVIATPCTPVPLMALLPHKMLETNVLDPSVWLMRRVAVLVIVVCTPSALAFLLSAVMYDTVSEGRGINDQARICGSTTVAVQAGEQPTSMDEIQYRS